MVIDQTVDQCIFLLTSQVDFIISRLFFLRIFLKSIEFSCRAIEAFSSNKEENNAPVCQGLVIRQ